MADGREQCCAHPVALGQRLGLRGLGPEPVPVQGGGNLRGEPVQQPGGQGPALPGRLQHEAVPGSGPQAGAAIVIRSARGHPHPLAAGSFQQLSVTAAALRQVPEYRGGRVLAAQHSLGEGQQVLGLLRAAGRLPGPERGQVHHAAHGDRDGHEQQQRQQALAVGDREGVHGGREVPVHEEAGDDRREHRGPEAADDRYRDDSDEVNQQVIAKVQVQALGGQGDRQQRQTADQQHPGQHPASAHNAGQVGDPAPAPGWRAARLLAVRGYIHNPQCEPCGQPAH